MIVDACIEVSKSSRQKYEYDETTGRLYLDRLLPEGILYPHNYGFIPNTLGNDGDALDVLVIGDVALMPLSWAKVRIVGYLDMEDEKGRDEKLVGFISNDPTHQHIHDIHQVPQDIKDEIGLFFNTYKKHETNKWAKVYEWHTHAEAKLLIDHCTV